MQLYYDQVVKDTVYRAGFAQYGVNHVEGGLCWLFTMPPTLPTKLVQVLIPYTSEIGSLQM